MHTARKDLAIQAFDRLGLTGRNRRLAIYWLSLWDGDRTPARGGARLVPQHRQPRISAADL
jgi:hypothetical protein